MTKYALVIEREDHAFLPNFKMLMGAKHVEQTTVITREITLLKELTTEYDAVITTRSDLTQRLSFADRVNIDDYAGSLFTRDKKDFLVLNRFQDLVASPPGIFLAKRYLSKIFDQSAWFPQTDFSWELADEVSIESLYARFQSADFLAVDIETTRGAPHIIRCVGYCAVWFNPNGTITSHSIVLPFDSMFWVHWVRKFNLLPQPKVFQNGLFDNSYFLRFNCPIVNWAFDTMEAFHCWYSELPKSLDAITAFLVRNVWYWKDKGNSKDLKEFYEYNARDTWATANSWLSLMWQAPDFVWKNYGIKFPLVFPCLAAGFEGVRLDKKKVDKEDSESLYNQQLKITENSLGSLRAKLGKERFNPRSPVQVASLLQVLLGPKLANRLGTDKKTLEKVAKKHPLNAVLIEEILKYRKAAKLVSQYLDPVLMGEDRVLYSLNPSGTDTARLASKKHFFDCGFQIQNVPEYAKQAIMADEGFYFGEADNEKSEAVCLGCISGDAALIESTTSDKDFHSINIERFFGRPYDEVWDSNKGKTKDKPLRDLSKRVNHGTAYVMGDGVLLETMGLENVIKAQKMLNLDPTWSPLKVCAYLLGRYHLAYPGVSKDYYEWVKAFVKQHGYLVSALGWTRICFGQPWNNPRHFKSLVAHVPQNLSVGIINTGMLRVFTEVQIPNWQDFRIKAQVHDSILFQYRKGRLDLALKARQVLQQSVPVTDVKGVTRIMTIPVALKAEATHWADLKNIIC